MHNFNYVPNLLNVSLTGSITLCCSCVITCCYSRHSDFPPLWFPATLNFPPLWLFPATQNFPPLMFPAHEVPWKWPEDKINVQLISLPPRRPVQQTKVIMLTGSNYDLRNDSNSRVSAEISCTVFLLSQSKLGMRQRRVSNPQSNQSLVKQLSVKSVFSQSVIISVRQFESDVGSVVTQSTGPI